MANAKPRKPPIFGTVLFSIIAVCAAAASTLIGYCLYVTGDKKLTEFYAKLGELSLQLSVIVIVGALVKVVVDWGTSQRTRYAENLEIRKEFMRRVRAIHVAVQNARDLMNAHRSAKTWSEQSRRLMELRPEVEEISEDLKVSTDLFSKRDEIVKCLEAIVSYLHKGGEEYIRSHETVDKNHKRKELLETIDQNGMVWISNFMVGKGDYKNQYESNIVQIKNAMRPEIYGQG